MFEDLKTVREKAGMTQHELAVRAGLDRPNLSAIEGGRRVVSLKLANRVLKALDEDDSPSAEDLVVANRIRAFQRAKQSGDLGTMLDSATAVAKMISATPEALTLFAEMVGEIEKAADFEDGFEEDRRDILGRVLPDLDGGQDDEEDEDLEDDEEVPRQSA